MPAHKGTTDRVAQRKTKTAGKPSGLPADLREAGWKSLELDTDTSPTSELDRRDRLAHLGGLVAEIVHEVRNPMVALKTFLQLLPDRLDDREFLTKFLDIAENEIQRIERLLDTLLRYAHPSPNAHSPSASAPFAVPTTTEVGKVLKSVETLLSFRATARKIGFKVESRLDCVEAQISADALQQVLLNLCLNAIDATPAGGRVEIHAESNSSGIELFVDDGGPGIPAELRERIFEPFVSTKSNQPGGLGLGISARLVAEAGGALSICDRPEGGTRFQVHLRAAGR